MIPPERRHSARPSHKPSVPVRAVFATIAGVAVCSLTAVRPVAGQVVGGVVLEVGEDTGIGGALVELLNEAGESRATAASNLETGRFRIAAPAAGRYRVRISRIGFEAAATDLIDLAAGDSVFREIRLERAPIAMDTMRVAARDPMTGLAKVMRRQRSGRGIYIPGAIISIADPHYLTQYLSYLLGGLFTGPRGTGLRLPGARCTTILINDWPYPVSASALDRLVTREIAAIEIYRTFRDVPPELQLEVYPCGLINVWTVGAW